MHWALLVQADYQYDRMKALELGAGVGLVGIVMALMGAEVHGFHRHAIQVHLRCH